MNSHQLGELLQLLTIVHHVPGRIRLRLVSVEHAQTCGSGIDDVQRFTTVPQQVQGCVCRLSMGWLCPV